MIIMRKIKRIKVYFFFSNIILYFNKLIRSSIKKKVCLGFIVRFGWGGFLKHRYLKKINKYSTRIFNFKISSTAFIIIKVSMPDRWWYRKFIF